MIAPAAMPPMTTAPTAQPKQPGAAVVGMAVVASATAAAAAKAVRVLVMISISLRSAGRGRPRPNANPFYEYLEPAGRKPGQFVGSVLRYRQGLLGLW